MNAIVWTSNSRNRKTGDIPTGWIRRSLRAASCKGCTHFNTDRPSQSACYAWRGTPSMAASSVDRGAAANPKRYRLANAIRRRNWSARAIRLGAIGDPSAADRKELQAIVDAARAAGLALLSYTHHWHRPSLQWFQGHSLASVDNAAGMRAAVAAGWKVARTVDADTFAEAATAGEDVWIDGARLLACPAMVDQLNIVPGQQRTCNDCLRCSPGNLPTYEGVAFALHGPGRAGKRWRDIVKARRKA